MGESGDHKPVSTSVYSNMEAIDMTAAGKMSCMHTCLLCGTTVLMYMYDVCMFAKIVVLVCNISVH